MTHQGYGTIPACTQRGISRSPSNLQSFAGLTGLSPSPRTQVLCMEYAGVQVMLVAGFTVGGAKSRNDPRKLVDGPVAYQGLPSVCLSFYFFLL